MDTNVDLAWAWAVHKPGYIVAINNDCPYPPIYEVQLFESKKHIHFEEEEIEFANITMNTNEMNESGYFKVKLNDLQKTGLSKELQVLVEEGILDKCLNIQDTLYILRFIVKKYQSEMAAQLLKERTDREEEKKRDEKKSK